MTAGAPPLGVYVHWPYCARICPYCDFNVYRDRGRREEQRDLKDAILTDIAAHAVLTGPRELVSVFLGGGTPSLMDPEWAAQIIEACRLAWSPARDLEVTLEANPTDAEAGRFAAFAQAGVNRLSLGVQSLDDVALKTLGRDHDAAEARRAAGLAARTFDRLSIDMIYARPGQSPEAWAEELRAAIGLGAEHVSPYQLTIEPGTAFDRAARRGSLVPPDEACAAALFETTQEVLQGAGFDAYEVSNHARGSAARSRHNLVYWRGEDYAGVGPGAHGRMTLGGVRHATEAHRRPADYARAVAGTGRGASAEAPLTATETAEERLLAGLRITEGVPYPDLAALGLTPHSEAVVRLVEDGLIVRDDGRLRATVQGRFVLNWLTGRLATA